MSKTFFAALGLFFACAAFSSDQNAPVTDFAGTWVGKWDNRWCVQFTIAEDLATTSISVLYEWQERDGKPLLSQVAPGLIDGKRFQIKGPDIEVFLSGAAGQAVALGHFHPPRAAVLVRESTRRCQADGDIR
jgi:hypothetical protein